VWAAHTTNHTRRAHRAGLRCSGYRKRQEVAGTTMNRGGGGRGSAEVSAQEIKLLLMYMCRATLRLVCALVQKMHGNTHARSLSLSSLSSTHTHSLLQGLWGHCHDHPPTPLQQPASVHCSAARTSPRALTGWRLSTTSSVAHGPEAQPPSCPVLYSCGGDILRVIQSRRYR
jgi:hypothetical protein